MENLFSEDPQFRRVQYKKLSDNVREWQQEISAIVSEKLPKDLGLSVTVTFQKVDDEKGYAVGTAVAQAPDDGSSIGVPIIVKSWQLAPIDLFFKDGKVFALTDDNLAKVFYQKNLGAGLAPKKAPPAMMDDAFADVRTPPLGGKYSYSSPFSALSLISGTLGAEDIELFKQAVAENPTLLAAYQRRGTLDILKKYAEEQPKPDAQAKADLERARGVFTVKKDGPNRYRIYSSPDGIYDPIVISAGRQALKAFLEAQSATFADTQQDPMSVVDRYGHFTLRLPDSPLGRDFVDPPKEAIGEHKNPCVFDPLQDDRPAKAIDSYGRYGVKDAAGVMAKGWVIPNVVDFDGNTRPIKLFLGKALGSFQNRIVGIPLADDDDTNLESTTPDTGKIGTLVYRDGENVVATVPFQVSSVVIYNGLRSIGVIDYQGNPANLILSPRINGIVKVRQGERGELGPLLGPKANYLMSANMAFVEMPRLAQLSEKPEDFSRKTLEHLDTNPVKVAMANGRYVFRGGAIAKYASAQPAGKAPLGEKVAFDFNALQRHEAEFLLAHWGLPTEKIAEALDGVRHRMLQVNHLRFPELPGNVKMAAPRAHLRDFARSLRAPMDEVVKIAAALEDAQSVDSVLSLGFVSEENVERFAAAQPMLWEMSNMLAKLLLAARLGMEDIPEESVRAALSHLQKVIEGLSRLSMLKEHKAKTASAKKRTSVGSPGGRMIPTAHPIGFAR